MSKTMFVRRTRLDDAWDMWQEEDWEVALYYGSIEDCIEIAKQDGLDVVIISR